MQLGPTTHASRGGERRYSPRDPPLTLAYTVSTILVESTLLVELARLSTLLVELASRCIHAAEPSHKEQTVIVSMGAASSGGCESWSLAHDYIVSKEHPAQWETVTTGTTNTSNSVIVDALRDPFQAAKLTQARTQWRPM